MALRTLDALAPWVASMTVYDLDVGAPGLHRGLPSTTLSVVLPIGEPVDVGWRDRPASRERRWSVVSGLHTAPAEIHHDGRQAGVQLALTIPGARALLGMPAGPLHGEILTLADLGTTAPWLRDLPERLAETATDDLARVVAGALHAETGRRRPAPPRPEVTRAIALLGRGRAVGAVADEVGYSRRHLGALVRTECGITPKQLQRLGRLERSRELLGRSGLADVARACGFADQAHLTREWVSLAGCTPTTWLREELPNLQDPPRAGRGH